MTRSTQNESLAIAGRNLFDAEAPSSNNTGANPPTPPKTLHEHSHPNPSGFQNPITLPTEQTGRIVDSLDIWLIKKTCTFQGLRNEDPFRHVKHYLSIFDNIQADGATRDTSRLHFFHFSLKGKAVDWLDRIPPTQIMTWDQLDDMSPPMNVSSISEAMQPTFRGRSHEADECKQNDPAEHVCLSGGDIYDDPSLLRFYQNDDTPPWGDIKRKKKGEDDPEWTIRSRFEDELANFMLEKKSHTKGIGEMLDQHRVSTQDPPFPAPSQLASANHTEGATKKEGPEDAEPSIIQEHVPRPSIFYQPSKSSNQPFPSRLKKQKKDDEDERLLSIFKQIHINLPFLEAMIHMPRDPRSLPQKEGDPGSFTLPCLIGSLAVKNALADLGASINLMPHYLFRRLRIFKLKPTKMSIQLADRSIKYPIGVCENLLVKVSKFIFRVKFVVLEMDEDELVPIILGRPFLATARAVIDVHEGKLSLRVGSETVTFNIRKSMKSKHSRDDYLYYADHTAKMIQEQWVDTVSHDGKWAEEEEEEDYNKVHAVSFYLGKKPIEPLEWKALENILKPLSVEPPKLELKELPKHLEYAFLQENNQLPVVISSALSIAEKARLLEVVKNHKGEIAWSIADIKGIYSSFCTHKILMEDEFKPSIQPQRRVNPNIKEVVKKEVIKILDARLIYPISDSHWVSHVQVVPKKGGMVIVKNQKDELIPQRTVTGWRVCIDYQKLNNVVWKDHFPLSFIDQMLELLVGHEYYCFLDEFSGYFQIPISPEDQEKTTFTCPYGTFAYKRMPFELCNAPATFQHCMTAISRKLIEDSMEVFMEDFSVFECIQAFDKLKRELMQASIMTKPDWSLAFKVMCDASDYAVGAVLGQKIDKHFKPVHYASKTMNEAQENYTTTEKELLVVVFAFDKFRQYMVLSKTIEFDIEIRDKKGSENLTADHLSRLENPNLGKLTKAEIRDLFLEERLMAISNKNNEPWYADYANYLASRVLPFRSTRQEKQKFFSDLRHYFWDEPFLFKQYADRIIRRCVAGDEATQILRQCHSEPSRGHHGITTSARKVFKAGFYWPHIFRDARNRLYGTFFLMKQKQIHPGSYRLHSSHDLEYQKPISDRGTHFCNYQMEKAMKRKDWSYKLDDALWAFRTAFKTPLGTTLFRIIYGKVCHLPVELEHKAYWAIKNCNLDLMKAGANWFLQINELDEMRLDAYESSISYKERTKRWHDKHIKAPTNYERGDKVLLFNSRLRLFPGKLKLRWYGPFLVYKDMKNSTIELYDEDGNEFIVNIQRVKLYQKGVLDTNKDN
ncbi:reverse transcriptase domain-containing protein [Tanacetum coccineum]|uniref:Reverse transcriptase domain-containing protein n=1 Tax=Tanacetum coccineum TaxID=301880 RepID=A0ABQ4WIU8_9ASTR